MAHYVILANFTAQGIKGIKDTGKRAQGFRDLAQKAGVTIKDIFWTMGKYDVVVTMEGPNDETVTALMMKMGALGNLKSQTLRAFSESEITGLTAKI
ncbi:MAG: GYD family protein [Candidatus Omnitrophica bacterium CG11_big_fil_rev_8_21_14_0_20_45_26]|uniref:GYD family protein n=1 Tax=Candidatus Abzuiibacterium crystallinum TaxID=1974748 RepID=A0A2H0LRV4_9BACT|nr:MAG: GYD family protein [Candidatus Omnitrophica bacterium CG11_big_fil_rev_8_21_14_0_20_45_26]PIW63305.1 MAG: GYD family protein [Candidatus Omnitrophica bacterium CG12_big_fil_rev_8_21_14_0_65_45_16]